MLKITVRMDDNEDLSLKKVAFFMVLAVATIISELHGLGMRF